MNNQELIDKYGGNTLVCYFIDVTYQFEDNHPDIPPLKKVAGNIFECHVTTLKVLMQGRMWHGGGIECMSAGYLMSNPYPIDEEEDETVHGSYLWAEEELRDMWYRDDENMFRDIEDVMKQFFILDDYWQPTLDKWRSVNYELQREHEYVGYMKPNRKGKWYDKFDKETRREKLVSKLIEMSVSYGDFTCNGSIPDGFSYDDEFGWEPFQNGVIEMVNVNDNVYRPEEWMEIGD